jgi:undecaprenyl-diphosphatase
MNIFQSILLGIVQGLTEFLPVSSSAHLVIVPYLLNWDIPAAQAFIFDVLVQVATLVAVFIYFWRDIVEIVKAVVQGVIKKAPFATPTARLGWLLLLATVPAGLFGLLFKDAVESAFGSPRVTALFLFVTAGLLVVAERVGKRNRDLESLSWKDALWVGIFQAMAIYPGISRSGATITGGMTRDFQRPAAARFAFLMSIPIMLASGLLASLDFAKLPNLGASLLVFIPGFIAAAAVDFAIYCAVL